MTGLSQTCSESKPLIQDCRWMQPNVNSISDILLITTEYNVFFLSNNMCNTALTMEVYRVAVLQKQKRILLELHDKSYLVVMFWFIKHNHLRYLPLYRLLRHITFCYPAATSLTSQDSDVTPTSHPHSLHWPSEAYGTPNSTQALSPSSILCRVFLSVCLETKVCLWDTALMLQERLMMK